MIYGVSSRNKGRSQLIDTTGRYGEAWRPLSIPDWRALSRYFLQSPTLLLLTYVDRLHMKADAKTITASSTSEGVMSRGRYAADFSPEQIMSAFYMRQISPAYQEMLVCLKFKIIVH